jgi:hypothetical protein
MEMVSIYLIIPSPLTGEGFGRELSRTVRVGVQEDKIKILIILSPPLNSLPPGEGKTSFWFRRDSVIQW